MAVSIDPAGLFVTRRARCSIRAVVLARVLSVVVLLSVPLVPAAESGMSCPCSLQPGRSRIRRSLRRSRPCTAEGRRRGRWRCRSVTGWASGCMTGSSRPRSGTGAGRGGRRRGWRVGRCRVARGAVRGRVDGKCLMGLPLDDPGFDDSVLSEFRGKVAGAELEQAVLDALLEQLAAGGLVAEGGKQRTDSTHVVAAVAALNRLELAGEAVRAALEALTAAHPDWPPQRCVGRRSPRRYGTPMTSWRPPVSQAQRDRLAIAYARDGYALLEAVCDPSAPAWLREIPAAGILRQVLLQNYTRAISADGREVIKRREKEPEGDGLPHGKARIASPYDTDARWGVKREQFWLGYKLHVTETCDDAPPCDCAQCPGGGGTDGSEPGSPGAGSTGHLAGCASEAFPNLITHVETTDATVPDSRMTSVIDDRLTGKNLAPGRHYLDSGSLSAGLVVAELARYGIALIGPLLADTPAQARAGNGYARADFTIDY